MKRQAFPPMLLPILAGWFLLSGWVAPAPALAQTAAAAPEHLTSLNIQVWPEYDDPRVLVQYDGQLPSQDTLPRNISFYIPSGAALYATAYVDSNNQLINTDPAQTQDAGNGYLRVTFQVPTPKFHLEYYYNPLQGSPDKRMEFDYRSAQTVDQLELQIQEPLKSDNFVTDPPSSVQTTQTHNFKYHTFDYTGVTPDQVLSVKVSYTKSDPSPSLANVTAPATAPASAEAAAAPLPWVPVALIGAGLALAALGFLAYRARNRAAWAPAGAAGEAPRRRHHPRAAGAFCPQCGRPLDAEDNFCPRCGSKKRA